MSDTMLFGVLKMPYEMAMRDEMTRTQFYQRVQELVARVEAQPEQEPSQWRDMVVVSLVREGINKHKARELADHFATPLAAQWEHTSASFDEWWDSDVMPSANPFTEGSAAFWGWAGWQAAQRKPLTDGEIYTAYITAANQTLRPQDERIAFAFARAIEAAHGIKEGT